MIQRHCCGLLVLLLIVHSFSLSLADEEKQVTVSKNEKIKTASSYGQTTKLDEGVTRWMSISLKNDEGYVMKGGSAGQSGDTSSVWATVVYDGTDSNGMNKYRVDNTYYDGKFAVLFRGIQKKPQDILLGGAATKIYRPVFTGEAEKRGGGGGGPRNFYEWKVNSSVPITRGKVKVDAWLAVSPCYLLVDANVIPFGPAIMPTNAATQVGAQDLFSWGYQKVGRAVWDEFLGQVKDYFIGLLGGDLADLINDLRSLAAAIGQRISVINAALANSQIAGGTLQLFAISGNPSGAVTVTYQKNGVAVSKTLSVKYSAGGESASFNIPSALLALNNGDVIRQILLASGRWESSVRSRYQADIRKAVQEEFGPDVEVEF